MPEVEETFATDQDLNSEEGRRVVLAIRSPLLRLTGWSMSRLDRAFKIPHPLEEVTVNEVEKFINEIQFRQKLLAIAGGITGVLSIFDGIRRKDYMSVTVGIFTCAMSMTNLGFSLRAKKLRNKLESLIGSDEDEKITNLEGKIEFLERFEDYASDSAFHLGIISSATLLATLTKILMISDDVNVYWLSMIPGFINASYAVKSGRFSRRLLFRISEMQSREELDKNLQLE